MCENISRKEITLGKSDHSELSKREREIMNILMEHTQADVAEVISHMRSPSSYSSIRKILSIMYEKGYLVREKRGKKYVFSPAISREKAESSAVGHLLRTYFGNSLESAISALLKFHKTELNKDYLDRLKELIENYEDEGG
jgi:BlaI family transcriptional regulator, penicillinase repressor